MSIRIIKLEITVFHLLYKQYIGNAINKKLLSKTFNQCSYVGFIHMKTINICSLYSYEKNKHMFDLFICTPSHMKICKLKNTLEGKFYKALEGRFNFILEGKIKPILEGLSCYYFGVFFVKYEDFKDLYTTLQQYLYTQAHIRVGLKKNDT